MSPVTHRPETVAPDAWCHLIKRRCGLVFRDTQVPAVLDCIRDEMLARGMTSEKRFYTDLSDETDAGPEWTSLVERLLNHETSFFRHPPSYDVLRDHIFPELRQARGRNSRLNLWSAGCATGQEAYSLAMVAMDALEDVESGETKPDFTVWGGDISRRAIEIARRSRYGPRAISGVPEEYRRRFLRPVSAGLAPEYEVVESLRQRVRFTILNLVGSPNGVNLNHDVILCHNVLIYLSPPAVSQVVALLASRLALGGYLLLGPGEAPSEKPAALEALNLNGVRVLRRRTAGAGEVRTC